eukprot:15383503-Alexandrium_andersonii.AAC.1
MCNSARAARTWRTCRALRPGGPGAGRTNASGNDGFAITSKDYCGGPRGRRQHRAPCIPAASAVGAELH